MIATAYALGVVCGNSGHNATKSMTTESCVDVDYIDARDNRTERLNLYGARDRFITKKKNTQQYGHVQETVIVGNPNVGKSTLFNLITGLADGGTGDPVELLDLAPSILELLDLPAPEPMEGRSLLPLLDGGEERLRLGPLPWREHAQARQFFSFHLEVALRGVREHDVRPQARTDPEDPAGRQVEALLAPEVGHDGDAARPRETPPVPAARSCPSA